MIDIRLVREDSDAVKAALGRRGVAPTEVDRLLELDAAARTAVGQRDELRALVKSLSKQVGEARRQGETALADELTERSRAIGDEERVLHGTADGLQEDVRQALLYLPNLPAADAPDGDGPEDNPVARTWPATDPVYDESQRVPHWEIGAELGLLDMERGAKLSGSMFPLYRGFGARILRALTSFPDDGPHRNHGLHRPPPEVRGGGLPPRAG
jgi:seryl-tRNA synthetase